VEKAKVPINKQRKLSFIDWLKNFEDFYWTVGDII
jgi:hypothetical protein